MTGPRVLFTRKAAKAYMDYIRLQEAFEKSRQTRLLCFLDRFAPWLRKALDRRALAAFERGRRRLAAYERNRSRVVKITARAMRISALKRLRRLEVERVLDESLSVLRDLDRARAAR